MKRRRQVPPQPPEQDPSTGSPLPGEPVFLAVGRLRRTHGIKGEIVMEILTDFPERLRAGKTVYVGDAHEPLRIASMRVHNQGKIVRFSGFETPEDAARLRNLVVFTTADDLPDLPEGEYYHHQLLGLTVVDEAGQPLGKLAEILETGANDVYLVRSPEGKELLIPAVDEVILAVDLERGEVRVRPPDWL
jgi:16S rRNA processing protein RimM